MKTAENIEKYMLENNLTDWQFCGQSGISYETLQNIKFKNFENIRRQTVSKLAALGIHVPADERHNYDPTVPSAGMTIQDYIEKHEISLTTLAVQLDLSAFAVKRHYHSKGFRINRSTLNKFTSAGIILPHISEVIEDDVAFALRVNLVAEEGHVSFIRKEGMGELIVSNKKELMAIKKFCRDNFYHYKDEKLTRGYRVRFKRKNVNRNGFDRVVL